MRSAVQGLRGLGCSAAIALVLLGGCYRTNVRLDPDAGPPPADAHRPPPPDAFAPDAFMPMSECARDRDCPGGALCVQDLALAPRDLADVPLRCGGPVGMLPPGAECEGNAACAHGMCALAGGCVAACADDGDCVAGERCTRVPVVTSPAALQFARACVRWVDPPPGVTVAANDALRLARFSTERLVVDPLVAPTRMVQHVADDRDDNRFVSLITSSSGEVVFDALQLGVSRQALVVAPFQDNVPILIPNGDPDFPIGTSFVASFETGETTALRRIVLDRAARGTTLDLNVFYVGIDAGGGGEPPRRVRQLLDELGVLLATVDLRLGRDRHFVMPGATARAFEVIESDEEVGELFMHSAGAARPALNVFLIRSGLDFLGIAGGAPGAVVVHGTRGSGIAIGFEDLLSILPMAPEGQMGTVIGHELGHFIGFFHTTEFDGTIVEPLSDTPECDLATHDLDRDGMLFPEECVGAGADNVMFWGPFLPDPRYSARQARILQNAMVLR